MSTFFSQWERAIGFGGSSEPNETHICGDMNIDMYQDKWLEPQYSHLNLSSLLKNICDVNNFDQLVKDITRVQWNSATKMAHMSSIDHVYTNAKYRCSDPVVISFGDSDHDIICYTRYSKSPSSPSRVIVKRNFKNFEKQVFLDELNQIDWSNVYCCYDVDLATKIFTEKFVSLLNVHAPWVKVQQRKNFAPWISSRTKHLIKERHSLKKEAKILSLSSTVSEEEKVIAWNKFKKVRNEINGRKKKEEHLYKSERLRETLGASDVLWKTAKSFMGWKSLGTPTQLENNGQMVTSARSVAQIMNGYFLEKVSFIRRSMQTHDHDTSKIREAMRNKTCELNFKDVSITKVIKVLKGLSNSRSSGVDGLDNYTVKLAADSIAKPLHYIITLSRWQQKFPSDWKFSKVIPLHKINDPLDMKNYRPVALLSPLSKVLEKIVFDEIYEYFSKNNLFHPSLHGYRKNRSTQTAMLQLYDKWVRAAASSKVSGAVLLDLSAAFDLVDPTLLLKKLKL